MNKRKRKNRAFILRRNKKIIRRLQRNNKRRKNYRKFIRDIYYPDRVYCFLRDKKFFEKNSLHRIKEKETIKIPLNFSISEQPNDAILALKRLFTYGIDKRVKEIEIDHSECKNLEIAASTIMDIIVRSIKQYRKSHNSDVHFCGRIPDHRRVKDVFIASGLNAHMEIEFKEIVSADYDNITRFKLQSGLHDSAKSDQTASAIGLYIDECLKTQGFALTDVGKSDLGMLFSEVLDNCEQHGGKDTIWFANGHYQIYNSDDRYGEAQLVIFNFGKTIFEQIDNPNASQPDIREKVHYLKEKHKPFFNSKWNEELMTTVLSLQGGISRLRNINVEGNKRRGTGTVRLIEKFTLLGQTEADYKPLMTITSGRSHIIFDGNYHLKTEQFNDEVFGTGERKIIAFNDDNNIFSPPNKNNVKILNQYFPGTIISLRFFLDRQYLTRLVN